MILSPPLCYDTPFHLLTGVCELEDAERLLPVFASSAMEVFPFQVAAANFALKAQYLKGAVLCDEGALGKTFEALMLIAQKWFEKRDRILIMVPLPLLRQWQEVMEKHFTFPFAVAGDTLPDGVVLATYEWTAAHAAELPAIHWDLAVLEEAHRLRKDNKESSAITAALSNASFKLLLTATPLTTSIMDLHSLISLIDPSALPGEKEFYQRYFRHEEQYGELAGIVGKYCFRTTRHAVRSYLQNTVPGRPYCLVFILAGREKSLFPAGELLEPGGKTRFPRHGEIRSGIASFPHVLLLFGSIGKTRDRRDRTSGKRLRKRRLSGDTGGYPKDFFGYKSATPAEISPCRFCRTPETRCGGEMPDLHRKPCHADHARILAFLPLEDGLYHGGADQSILKFQREAQILIATDAASEGFNLEFCSFLVNYGLPYNTLTVEQRINRCHRQNQKSDVLVLNFLNPDNFADVRTLELVNKRMAQFNGIIGLSDDVLGSIGGEFADTLAKLRNISEIEQELAGKLKKFSAPNQQLLKETSDTLFSSFTPEVARNIRLTPEYVKVRCAELNATLWAITKGFFSQFPDFQFDDGTRTLRCPDPPPKVFTGARLGRSEYSMSPDYQPRSGRHTLTGCLARNLLGEIHWRGVPESGILALDASVEPCRIALYRIKTSNGYCSRFAGKTAAGRELSDEECRALLKLPVAQWKAQGELIGEHNRYLHKLPHDDLDDLVKTDEVDTDAAAKQKEAFLQCRRELEKQLDAVKAQVHSAAQALENVSSRMEKLRLQRKHAAAVRTCKEAEQRLYLCIPEPLPRKAPAEAMRLFSLTIQPARMETI